jgi:hypothetical protein
VDETLYGQEFFNRDAIAVLDAAGASLLTFIIDSPLLALYCRMLAQAEHATEATYRRTTSTLVNA